MHFQIQPSVPFGNLQKVTLSQKLHADAHTFTELGVEQAMISLQGMAEEGLRLN